MRKLIDRFLKRYGYRRVDDFWHQLAVTTEVKKRGNQHGKWESTIVIVYLNAHSIYKFTARKSTTIRSWVRLQPEARDDYALFNRALSNKEIEVLANNERR